MLCDNNCITVFDSKKDNIYNDYIQEVLLYSYREPDQHSLCLINMEEPQQVMTAPKIPEHLVANHIDKTETKQTYFFYHTVCFSPNNHAFITTIKNKNFTSWPGLVTKLA